MPSQDLSPVLPSKYQLIFRGRRCSGLPSDTVPAFYASSVTLANVTLDNNAAPAGIAGTPGTTWTARDTALALYTVGGPNPTNKTALDALANRAGIDFWNFRSAGFDLVYNGIINPAPSGLNDTLEFGYTHETQWTRVQSQPLGGEPEEFQRQDPAAASCTDLSNAPNPVTHEPCTQFYGPPESCTGGGGTITLTIAGGVITGGTATGGSFNTAPSLAISGDGSGAAGTITLASGTAPQPMASLTITAGGSGYSYAIGSPNGGGTKLQRTRYILCLQDGRLVAKFVSFDTIS